MLVCAYFCTCVHLSVCTRYTCASLTRVELSPGRDSALIVREGAERLSLVLPLMPLDLRSITAV